MSLNVLLRMRNHRASSPWSLLTLSSVAVGVLAVVYIGLIAVVMSYAAVTVEFSQSVKSDGAQVAVLEAQYLASVSKITTTDYKSLGYVTPVAEVFVLAKSVTALR